VDDIHGRPALEGEQVLRFNWSHSGSHALIAVATKVQPGIDLEQLHRRRRRDALALARRFFAADEAAALARLPEDERELAFLRAWTAKEALLKAHGRGLAFGLDRVRVAVPGDAQQLLGFAGEDPDCWQLHGLDAGTQHVASLAWRGGPRTIRWMSRLD
jgi:4'-phosphopantetheinyl transferase